tara:strand:+ start:269 stop:1252 length:984 start_codon:yes stop_codon:yes gene_type:complete
MARDYRKYLVNNNSAPLSKRALALEIVRSYNTDNKPTFKKIKEIFPDEVQGAKGFIRKKSEKYDPKRFHEAALISSDNVQYLVSNQWGSKNISGLLKKGKNLGIQIKEFNKLNDKKNTVLKTEIRTYYKEDGNFGKDKKTGAYKSVNQHDGNGNLIESLHYNREGELWDKKAYKYDSKNNLLETFEIDENGELELHTKHDAFGNYYWEYNKVKFDSKGQLQQSERYSSGELMSKVTYEYNKDVCIIKSYNSGGRLESSIKYDRERKKLEYIKWKPEYDYLGYDFKGMKLVHHQTYEYEYDSLNNWIKSTCYSNESLYYIAERKIEYS